MVAAASTEVEEAIERERLRLANDLHDTAGQTLLAIFLLARRWSAEDPVSASRMSRLAELAAAGREEIDLAIKGLTFAPALDHGLLVGLEGLARSFQPETGILVVLDVLEPPRLNLQTERALFRVAHQALVNAWRHARCSTVRISLEERGDGVVLSVTDDGVGMGHRWPRRGPGMGVASMRRAVEEAGGRLQVTNIKPHGVRVEATVPPSGR